MKKKLLILVLFIICANSNAQTAPDWTLTDCSGNNHNLYSYLDSGQVVIMEFGMGCSSCSDAATPLINKKSDYSITYPGKVKVMYMDYWAGNDCTMLDTVFGIYSYDGIFNHCLFQKDDYFVGSPMPGIVIAAGPYHDVIYKKTSFMEPDTVNIKAAIDNFFATVSVNEMNSPITCLNVYPNPANSSATLIFDIVNVSNVSISLFDNLGKQVDVVATKSFARGTNQLNIDVSKYPKGIYTLKLDVDNQTITKKLLVE